MRTPLLIPLIATFVGLTGCHQPPEFNLKSDERLANCPSSPNCVNSQAPRSDTGHWIAPLRYNDNERAAWKRLKNILANTPRMTVVTATEDYLHVTVRSRFFRFVDDVEFLKGKSGEIHVRSASRLGYSDLGVNRSRIEEIRQRFKAEESDR